jgi:hypothetical protein
MTWFGADPGGIKNFGIAVLQADGSFRAWCRSSVDEAVQLIEGPQAVGIDCKGRPWAALNSILSIGGSGGI